jgi:hypothetical protein
MKERDEKGRGAGCVAASTCAVLFLLFALYVLAPGPANRAAEHFPAALPWLELFYAPLAIVAAIVSRSKTPSSGTRTCGAVAYLRPE